MTRRIPTVSLRVSRFVVLAAMALAMSGWKAVNGQTTDGEVPENHEAVVVMLPDRAMRIVTCSFEHCHGPISSARRVPGGHEVQHGSEAEQVGAMVQRATIRLCGRHVMRRTGDGPLRSVWPWKRMRTAQVTHESACCVEKMRATARFLVAIFPSRH